jgi:prepilin-type processing-associated H-X9-DG protein
LKTYVSTFYCPSEPIAAKVYTPDYTLIFNADLSGLGSYGSHALNFPYAASSYAPIPGIENNIFGTFPVGDGNLGGGRQGILSNGMTIGNYYAVLLASAGYNTASSVAHKLGANKDGSVAPMTRIADVTDGLSNTFILEEVAGRPQLWYQNQRIPAGQTIPYLSDGGAFMGGINYDDPSVDQPGCGWGDLLSGVGTWFQGWNPGDPIPQNNLSAYEAWASAGQGGQANNSAATAGKWTQMVGLTNAQLIYGPASNMGGMYSFHPGGANALFADGSVHFISSNIDYTSFYYLVTCQDGQIIPNTPN